MIIDGKTIASKIRQKIKKRVERMDPPPSITVILIGDNTASSVYVNMKEISCKEAGIRSEKLIFPEDITETQLIKTIDRLNADDAVDAILVQLPLPKHISDSAIIKKIDPRKDVDGFHPINIGLNQLEKGTLIPCTPKGVIRLLEEIDVDIAGKHAVIVGRSNIVGKPLVQLFLQKDSTVTICHSRTKDLASYTKDADILVAAVGRPNLIKADMVKSGVIVIDVGVNRVNNRHAKRGYSIVGDVDFESVRKKAAAITPVPGGVGPMTIAMLMENAVIAAEERRK